MWLVLRRSPGPHPAAASNSKLVDRALRMLRDLAGVPREDGERLLEAAGGSVKLALLMAATGLEAEPARVCLREHNEQLRPALASCGAALVSP